MSQDHPRLVAGPCGAPAVATQPGTCRGSRVVTVVSNKGGVGKTTIATNLAIYLRALHPDLPVLVMGLDDQPVVNRMFALGSATSEETVLEAVRSGSLASAVTLGQYGVHYVPPSAAISELKAELRDPFHLRDVLGHTAWPGLVIIDTKADLELLTQNAIAASHLAIVVVSDQTALMEAQKVFDLLETWQLPRERARVLLSMVDLRIKFRSGDARDILSLLLAEIRRLEYPLFDTFISRSPKIEALYTNPEGRALSVLHHAPGSLIHNQLRHLAESVLEALLQTPPGPPTLRGRPVASLRPLTPLAAESLPGSLLRIERFPFRIGRNDPDVENDLALFDRAPWQLSRHHVEMIERNGRIGVVDLGSRLGCLVAGRRLGGEEPSCGPVFLPETGGTLVLGNDSSPFAFSIAIS